MKTFPILVLVIVIVISIYGLIDLWITSGDPDDEPEIPWRGFHD